MRSVNTAPAPRSDNPGMRQSNRFAHRVCRWTSPLAFLILAACGGGGGGGDDGVVPVTYTGNANSAVISTTNAGQLLGNILGSQETATIILGSDGGGATGQSPPATAMRPALQHAMRATALRASADRVTAQALVIDQTEPCDNNVGTTHTTGTLSDTDFTGTLTLTFSGCLVGTDTLDGTATLRVDAFGPGLGVPIDSTLSFARLTIRGPAASVDASGSLRLLYTANTETLTLNLVTRDNIAARESKAENLVFISSVGSGSVFASVSVSGRVFDQVHGYVDVTTPIPLVFYTPSQAFADGGQIVLTGASNHRVRATALSSTVVRLELDLTGSGYPIGKAAIVDWTQLSGPAGADLGDDDHDGLHNSWETVNGFDPASATDAAVDSDGDGTSNIREYYVGANPRHAGPVAELVSTLDPAYFFGAAASYPAGAGPQAVAVGDFNGDGRADAAIANWNDNTVSVLLGDGAGGLGTATPFAAGPTPTSIAVGDFNGDGRLDLAVANFGGPSVSIMLGNGAGGFGAPTQIALTAQLNPNAVVVGDFNSDGKADLAVAMSYGFSNITPGHVAVLLGNGAGGFAAPANFAVGGSPNSVATGDFNGDGKADLAVANSLVGTASVLLGDGTGAFAAAPDLIVDGRLNAIAVGDFNGDGKPDLALTVNTPVTNDAHVAILTGTGTGTFGPASVFVLDRHGATLTGLTLADFDGDGRLDLAASDQGVGRAFVLLGDGAGSFGTINYVVALPGAPAALAVGHFNGDGKPDLIAATVSGTSTGSAVLSLNILP